MVSSRALIGGLALAAGMAVMAPLALAGEAPIEITVGKENAKRTIIPGAGAQAGQSFKDCPDCPEMVVVPAGSFMMGSPENELGRRRNEGPQHKVTIAKPFAVAKFELTWGEWDACYDNKCAPGETGCVPNSSPSCYKLEADEKWGRGKRPLINADSRSLDQFLMWLKEKTGKEYRLLTEAEWEYAARAGSTTPYPTGAALTKQQARFGEEAWNEAGKTAEAGSFAPNAFGLHDMNGNVWEWVQDCWHDNYEGAPKDGSKWLDLTMDWKPLTACTATGGKRIIRNGAWIDDKCPEERCKSGRILRGGSWSSDPRLVRSAYRANTQFNDKTSYYGFRLARPLD